MTDADLETMTALANLRNLSIGPEVTEAGLAAVRKLKHLETVSFRPRNANHPPLTSLQWAAGLDFTRFDFPPFARDADLAHFAGMRRLQSVRLPPLLTNAGLQAVAQFPALTSLNLSACSQITDAGLAELARCQGLKELLLPPQITDAGMEHVARLQGLKRLTSYEASRVTAQGIAALVNMKGLTILTLGPGIDDSVAPHLRKMTSLEQVMLYRASVTGKFFDVLPELPNLQGVNLIGVVPDDHAVAVLQKLDRLQSLLIQSTGLPPDRLGALKRALPKAQITH